MYSDRDMNAINRRIRGDLLALLPVLAALLAAYIYAMARRVEWLAMAAGPLLFVAGCYGLIAKLLPHLRYRGFLRDAERGLSREVRGVVVAVSADAEPQDGAMVLPVRVKLDAESVGRLAPIGTLASKRLGLESPEDTDDERIVYLNASKREGFPPAGTAVALTCFGRHIRKVEVL